MALSDVRIQARPGETQVVIDGGDISKKIRAVRVDLPDDGLPTVWVETRSGVVDFDGAAIVKVPVGQPVDEWLSNIDPALLDQAVNQMLQLDPGTYAELLLKVLITWAKGEA